MENFIHRSSYKEGIPTGTAENAGDSGSVEKRILRTGSFTRLDEFSISLERLWILQKSRGKMGIAGFREILFGF